MKSQLLEINEKEVNEVYSELKKMILNSRSKVQHAVNVEMLNLYWYIGKKISELQEGESRAKYGIALMRQVSDKLTEDFGNGFSIQNLRKMRQFYNLFQIRSTVLTELSWSHYLELIRIKLKEYERLSIDTKYGKKYTVSLLYKIKGYNINLIYKNLQYIDVFQLNKL